ncbi:FAD-binding oxidoreductase [Synechococcus elongatus IITB4]|uniref:FAD-dependent oxidoreductase n=1 Tax=Synechococcus elongatus TaxID=32046 RepID=UPI0030CA7CFE
MSAAALRSALNQLSPQVRQNLRQTDAFWRSLRWGRLETPQWVSESAEMLGDRDVDVLIAGGTLGLLPALWLQQQGWRVGLVERGAIQGRDQEWNISRRELVVLVELGLLSSEELEAAIATEFPAARIAFPDGPELWVEGILNVGISPRQLIATLLQRFRAIGGQVLAQTAIDRVTVHPDGVAVYSAQQRWSGRLLLDTLGHFSPIARQARQGAKPDAVCLVVGGCAQGFPASDRGDLFVSRSPIQQQRQAFWEAFPAVDGRTAYLFTYIDAQAARPSLQKLFCDYFEALPDYQGVDLAQLQWQRLLWGILPSYRNSPLQSCWNRILAIGDSSGAQSPLSFGGFGALLRHLPRLCRGIHEALLSDCLQANDLALLQPHQPSLTVTWLFQQSMTVPLDRKLPPDSINELLGRIFAVMDGLGPKTLKPFLQDVVQFQPLAKTLLMTTLLHPVLVAKLLPQLGLKPLLQWLPEFLQLGLYRSLAIAGEPTDWLTDITPAEFQQRRRREAWVYGSGCDYH